MSGTYAPVLLAIGSKCQHRRSPYSIQLYYDFYHGSLNGVFMILFTLKILMVFSIMHKMTQKIFYFMASKRIYHGSIHVIPKEHLTKFFMKSRICNNFLFLALSLEPFSSWTLTRAASHFPVFA